MLLEETDQPMPLGEDSTIDSEHTKDTMDGGVRALQVDLGFEEHLRISV